MKPPEREEWVVVAEFTDFHAGLTADLTVSRLQGSGISAVRFPTGVIAGAIGTAMIAWAPIRVVVPPDEEERAREILADGEQEAEING